MKSFFRKSQLLSFNQTGDKMSKEFSISVIMPVVNNEKYLEASVGSITGQTTGFEKNIQLIFVDGGAGKNEKLCREFQKKYPDNIEYINAGKTGVAALRNIGMEKAKGKYINFFRCEDKWNNGAFSKLCDLLEKEGEATDAAAARRKNFDGAGGYHSLDYKFAETAVIDLEKKFDFLQTDVSSLLIRAEAARKLRFCEELPDGGDGRYIAELLSEKCTLAVCREAEYELRARTDNGPEKQGVSDSYYYDVPRLYHKAVFEMSRERSGEIKKFIQYMVMYDLAWRIKKPVFKLLDEEKHQRYSKLVNEIIAEIDDDVIYRQRCIYMNMKMYCLSLKYGHDVRKDLTSDNGKIMYKNFMTIDLNEARTLLIWDYVELRGNILRLEGKDNCWMRGDDFNYYAKVGGEIYYPSYSYCSKFDLVTMNGSVNRGRAVVFELHLNTEKEVKISFFYRFKDKTSEIYTSLGKFSHLPKVEGGYYAKGKIIIRQSEKGLLSSPNTPELHKELENNFRKYLSKAGREDIIELREKYFELSENKKKELWMISDRSYVAGDNGEHFFRYMSKRHRSKINTVFNINEDCDDYERMKKIGRVVPYDTDEYKMDFLLADKLISSTASDYLFNPFGDDKKYLVDLIHWDYIFLQHGITKDDLSSWLNHYNKNIRRMCTASLYEYLSIVDGDYCMEKEIPILSGFARFDNLYRLGKKKPKKKILIMPTWRNSIKGSYDPKTNKSVYFAGFRDTEYYKFYNSLINDERLLCAMKERGYTGVLCMHPMHSLQCTDFTGNDVFAVNDGLVDYQKEFVSSALLVTDYSSVAFDFAYLKKPVVYAQFDRDEFYKKHTYKEGYFSYEKNGFGPVCSTLDETVNAIIASLDKGCSTDEKYLKRTDDFYPYHDAHNCKRIYEFIREIID